MEKNDTNKKLEDIIRGERSAVETYQKVQEKISSDPKLNPLMDFSSDHIRSAQYFVDLAKTHRVEVPSDSGMWGSWANFTTSIATSFGDKASLKILKEGEEHGLKMYRSIMEDDTVDTTVKNKVQSYFIPQQLRHIEGLDQLMNRI